MKHYLTAISLFSVMLLPAFGCLSDDGIDKGKFAELGRTAQDLRTTVTSSNPCVLSDEQVQTLAAGIASAREKTAGKAERDVIVAYSHLLTTYKDGLLLCRSRTHLAQFSFVPKGRIYVTQELDPLVERYGFPTERHTYRPTGQVWKSIDGNSIRIIWDSAVTQTKSIENMVTYN